MDTVCELIICNLITYSVVVGYFDYLTIYLTKNKQTKSYIKNPAFNFFYYYYMLKGIFIGYVIHFCYIFFVRVASELLSAAENVGAM